MLLFEIFITVLIVIDIIVINTKKEEWDGQDMRSQEMRGT